MAKYPQGLKEVRPDMHSRALADAVSIRIREELFDLKFLDTIDVTYDDTLRPEAPLCNQSDLDDWRANINSCVIAEIVLLEECQNRDGCAILKLSPAISTPDLLPKVFEAIETPCRFLPDKLTENYSLMQHWYLPGLRLSLFESHRTLRCGRDLAFSVAQHDPVNNTVRISF